MLTGFAGNGMHVGCIGVVIGWVLAYGKSACSLSSSIPSRVDLGQPAHIQCDDDDYLCVRRHDGILGHVGRHVHDKLDSAQPAHRPREDVERHVHEEYTDGSDQSEDLRDLSSVLTLKPTAAAVDGDGNTDFVV